MSPDRREPPAKQDQAEPRESMPSPTSEETPTPANTAEATPDAAAASTTTAAPPADTPETRAAALFARAR